jgi:hypothetical protein
MSCLACVATTINAEEDWIVVLAEGYLNYLASKWGYICHFITVVILF